MTASGRADHFSDLAAKIEALELERSRIEHARRWLNLTQCAREYDSLGEAIVSINKDLARLEGGLKAAEEVRFSVVWAATGAPVTPADLRHIALEEPWAEGLIYCDMEGFAVEEDGTLLLLDECGHHRYPPEGLFRVVLCP